MPECIPNRKLYIDMECFHFLSKWIIPHYEGSLAAGQVVLKIGAVAAVL
jgi:hypothetical protein